MKRLFAVAAALLLCGALTACGGQEEPSGAESQVSVASAQEESSQAECHEAVGIASQAQADQALPAAAVKTMEEPSQRQRGECHGAGCSGAALC